MPDWAVQAIACGTVTFVFKVVFGLISKNEQKSEAEDRRLEAEIKELRAEMKEVEERYRSNDRDLYRSVGEVKESLAEMKGR